MALDVASLTLDDSQASLASMPEELWRKVTSYLTPATTARAFVVAGGRSSSLQEALRAEIEQTERDLFGATRRGAEELLVDDILVADLIFELMLFTSNHLLHDGARTRADRENGGGRAWNDVLRRDGPVPPIPRRLLVRRSFRPSYQKTRPGCRPQLREGHVVSPRHDQVVAVPRRRPAAPRPDGRQPVGWFRGLRAVTYVSKSIKRPMARGESPQATTKSW